MSKGRLIQFMSLAIWLCAMAATQILITRGYKFGWLLMVAGMLTFVLMLIEGYEIHTKQLR